MCQTPFLQKLTEVIEQQLQPIARLKIQKRIKADVVVPAPNYRELAEALALTAIVLNREFKIFSKTEINELAEKPLSKASITPEYAVLFLTELTEEIIITRGLALGKNVEIGKIITSFSLLIGIIELFLELLVRNPRIKPKQIFAKYEALLMVQQAPPSLN